MEKDYSKDTLTEAIGVLTRREVEARILIPVIRALGEKFGPEDVKDLIEDTIISIAKDQGRELARHVGGNSLSHFTDSLELWTRDNALEIDINHQDDGRLSFDVTRCRYAEMYKAMDARDLGRVFSCNRDFALIEGFNPRAYLIRETTIMDGDPVCKFRYEFPE